METFLGGLGAAGTAGAALKVAPVVMTGASLLTKDKTLKDLLGVGSLLTSGANLIGLGAGGAGAADTISKTANAPAAGAAIPTPTAQAATAPATGANLKNIVDTGLTLGQVLGQKQEPVVQAPPQKPPISVAAASPVAGAGFTPSALRFAQMLMQQKRGLPYA